MQASLPPMFQLHPKLASPGIHLPTGNPMRQYQIRAAHKIFKGSLSRDPVTGVYIGPDCDGSMVHVDMGLGKTITALTACVDWYAFGVLTRPCLVVAPIKVCESVWKQEALQWSHTRHLRFALLRGNEKQRAYELARCFDPQTGERKVDIVLVNPELVPWLKKWLRGEWGFFDALIIDDVAWRDPASKQFRAISNYGDRHTVKDEFTGKSVIDPTTGKRIRMGGHRFKRACKLSGTPSPAGLHQLWAPSYLMDHGFRLSGSYDSFEARFFHKTKKVTPFKSKVGINAEEDEQRPAFLAVTGAPERIHELIADVTIELNAEDYGVLPKVIGDASKGELPDTHLHRVGLPGELRAQYDRLEKEAIIELMAGLIMAQNGGAKSMLCWQYANGCIYDQDEFGQQIQREIHTGKLDKLVELIDRITGNVMVPYYFKSDYERITARLNKEGVPWESLKGKNSDKVIERWNEGRTPVLLIHPQSAAHGLNLQFGGNHIIWFTLLWSLERYLQTLARLARSGQSGVVQNHHIATTNTTDELMLLNLRMNGSNQDRFRSAVRAYQQLRGLDLMEGLGV